MKRTDGQTDGRARRIMRPIGQPHKNRAVRLTFVRVAVCLRYLMKRLMKLFVVVVDWNTDVESTVSAGH